MTDRVQWGRTTIDYDYEYKDRKTLSISVHPDLSVSVSAPKGTKPEDIRGKVKKRAAWIKKAKREFELYLPKQPPRRYINGETHRYLGRQYRLKARKGKADSVKCYRGYFNVICSTKPTPEKVKVLLDEWFKDKANDVFKKRFDICNKKAFSYRIKASTFSIRKLKNRWGSCTKNGRIILNLDLIKAPIECIDYVIMHELCHLKEHHHGTKFWALLDNLLPNYIELKRRLNKFSDI